MTIQQALNRAIVSLRKHESVSAVLDAEVLLAHVLKTGREHLLANPTRRITPAQYFAFAQRIKKCSRGWPVAYLTGHKEFYGLDFAVTPDVLIPRPETELLVDEVLQAVKRTGNETILDMGTGSGCIAITLAKYLPQASITAVDVSLKALLVAKKNARRHKLSRKITFIWSDIFLKLEDKQFDIIVANLPYLTADQTRKVQREPRVALHGGKMGGEIIDKFVQTVANHLTLSGKIFFEIDPGQKELVAMMMERYLPGWASAYANDLAGFVRVVSVKKR